MMSLLLFQAADPGSFGLPGFLTAVVLLWMFPQLPGNSQAEAQGGGITLSGSACAPWTSHHCVCPLVFWGFGLGRIPQRSPRFYSCSVAIGFPRP